MKKYGCVGVPLHCQSVLWLKLKSVSSAEKGNLREFLRGYIKSVTIPNQVPEYVCSSWSTYFFLMKRNISYYSILDHVSLSFTFSLSIIASRFSLYLGSQRSLSSKILIRYFKKKFSIQVIYVHCRKSERDKKKEKWKYTDYHSIIFTCLSLGFSLCIMHYLGVVTIFKKGNLLIILLSLSFSFNNVVFFHNYKYFFYIAFILSISIICQWFFLLVNFETKKIKYISYFSFSAFVLISLYMTVKSRFFWSKW